jgi:GH43 family beta-xylosidase
MTYSGAASSTELYKIGVLELKSDNTMNTSHWFHNPNPLFGESKETGVYGTGHASYVKSKDSKQDYIVYHAMADAHSGWVKRTTRIRVSQGTSRQGGG